MNSATRTATDQSVAAELGTFKRWLSLWVAITSEAASGLML